MYVYVYIFLTWAELPKINVIDGWKIYVTATHQIREL